MSTDSAASPFMLRFLSHKRHRWVAGAFVLILIVLLAVQNHEALLPPREMATNTSQCADEVDWSRFAYAQYVTNSVYLCNSVMFFESLHRLSSRADRVMMYPSKMLPGPDGDEEEVDLSKDARLLIKARDEYNVKLVPITVQRKDNADATWADSFTKLLAFNQTQYSRVLSIDSDSLLLQHMDELFLLPPSPVAMPRAYWLLPDQKVLSSQLVLLEPSDAEFARVMAAVDAAPADDYDMEIVNRLYRDSALVLPHRPYDLLTGEFRGGDHARYLGGGSGGDGDGARWDPAAVYSEAKLVHFSDWPLPKPWLKTPEAQRRELEPECVARVGEEGKAEGEEDEEKDCTARLIWNSFYADFKKKRKEVCTV